MENFAQRLLTFEPSGADHGEVGWSIITLRPVDMAGAGFYFTGRGTRNFDSVTCYSCKLQAWKWAAKDDPFEQHRTGSPSCKYTKSKDFDDYHKLFLRKKETKTNTEELLTPPTTPVKNPKTTRPRRKMALSKIMTVYDIDPSYAQEHRTDGQPQEGEEKPVGIAITSGKTKIIIQINDNDVRGTKRVRIE